MGICRWAFPHLRESTMDNVKAWINMQSATSVWWLIQILARKKAFPSLALGKVLIQKTIVKTSSSNHLILILPCQPVLWILQKVNTPFLTIDPMQYKTATPVCLKTYLFQNVREQKSKERGWVRHILPLLKFCLESPVRLVSLHGPQWSLTKIEWFTVLEQLTQLQPLTAIPFNAGITLINSCNTPSVCSVSQPIKIAPYPPLNQIKLIHRQYPDFKSETSTEEKKKFE